MANTILGIGLMLISTSIMNLGMVLQKKAVDSLPAMDTQTLKANLKGVLSIRKIKFISW